MRLVGLAAASSLFLPMLGAVAPGTALATPKTLYAAPNGNGLATCGPDDPCDSVTATTTAASGDTVVFYGDRGTYQTPGSPTNVVLHVKNGVTLTGAPGQPMPVWYSQVVSPNAAVTMDGPSGSLVDFDIEDVGGSFPQALDAVGSLDRVLARASTTSGVGCLTRPGVTISNSICAGQNGIFDFIGGGGAWNLTLRNDLIYGVGNALYAGSNGPDFHVVATNTIFRSTGGHDIDVTKQSVSGSMDVTADHSNYATASANTGATVTAAGSGTNQTAAPQFVNAGADFREAAGSPTIDAGVDDPLNGLLDLAGTARTSGARTDIGPYEVQVVPPTPPPPSGGAPPPATTQPSVVAPVVSALSESARTWRVGSASPRFARKRRPPLGTTFTFGLNEAARVTLSFTQRSSGRRVSPRCVRPTRRNARRPRCRRTVTAGALGFGGHAGTNRVRFEGRLSRTRRLKPGRYTLVVAATASSGLRSTPRSVSFTVVR